MRFASTYDKSGAPVVAELRGDLLVPLEGFDELGAGTGAAALAVLGYTVANDVTMRDYQYKTHQWTQGKAWDACTPLGPYLVTPDEVDIDQQTISTVINGVKVQESPISLLIFTIPRLIATISEFTELCTGDVILTGTPAGVGHRREPPLYLKSGDVISVEVTGVGVLRNTIA